MYNQNENSLADQLLVKKVLAGDTNAFKIIIEKTEGLVTQIIFKMIPASEDRKDIAQDVYLKAFQKLVTFRFQSKLSTWIGQITYNTCVNHLQKKKVLIIENSNEGDESNDEALEIMNSKIGPANSETEKRIFNKELSGILKREIDKLSPLYRTLITLYHNQELSYSEIAIITELPEGTVKNYLFRARKTLKNNLLLTYKKEAL